MLSYSRLFWLFVLVALSTQTAQADDKAKVFLLAGQSNMVGLGTVAELQPPYSEPREDVRFWKNGEWVALSPGLDWPAKHFGPEISFGHAIRKAFPDDDIYLIKYAVSGTALYNDWTPTDGPQYKRFMQTARAALAHLDEAKVPYEIVGMLWMQGESDANEKQGQHYEANLRQFIAHMREQFKTPDMPFLLGRVLTHYGGKTGQAKLVRQAQQTVAESTAKVAWFDTDYYSKFNAGHYGTQGQLNMGNDFARHFVGVTTGANVSPTPNRPNIVWIFVEDMNGWMSCYGDNTVQTPHIDSIAQRGVRFTRAYMPAGVCSATRSAIALGTMQTTFGVHNHRSSRKRVPGEVIHLPQGVETVYELLREAGYYVASNSGKNDFNFIFKMNDLYDHVAGGMNLNPNKPHWQGRAKSQPFFAQIQLRGGKNSGKVDTPVDPTDVQVPPYYPDHPVFQREYAHHYDCIKQTDNEVGEVLAALERDGLMDNTIIFFWTDHGMRMYRHKQWLYEGGIHVPLVIAGPGIASGEVCDDLVSGIDITAATLALAGVEIPDWMEGRDFFAHDHEPRNYVIAARDRCDYTIERVRAVVTPRYKYIRNFLTDRPFMQPQYRDGRDYIEVPRKLANEGNLNETQMFWWSGQRVPEELYDLQADPHEIHNLVDDPAYSLQLEQHRKILQDWIERTDDKGQYPESVASLQGVLKRWNKQAVNPEYEKARKAMENGE